MLLDRPDAVYFHELRLQNVRCFAEEQVLRLTAADGTPAQWTVLLGENGTGKTTVLQALELMRPTSQEHGVNGPMFIVAAPGSGLEHLRRVGRTTQLRWEERRMVGHLPGLQLSVGDGRDLFWAVQKSPTVSVSSSHSAPMRQVFFAYGAQRALRDAPELLAGRLSSLFIPGRSRMDPVDWLLRLDHARKSDPDGPFDAQFERVRAALVRLLPGVEGVRVGKPDRDAVASRKLETPVEALTHEGWLPIQALSLGYQGMLAWVVDLAAGLMEAYPDAEDPLAEPAVCLVDELDLHLHPAWQQQIVDHLTGIFRRTQFVVTAHSPLVIQPAAGFANVALLRREGDHVVIENDPELVRTWRVDQILTSELFGLRSARDPRVDALMDERARILADGPDAAGWARVRAIDEELGPVDAFEDPEHRRTMGELRGLLERLQSTG